MNTQELYQKTDAILARYGTEERSMIAVLQAVQEEYAYLPREVFPYLSEKMGLSEAHIYGVATFYENFSLEPKGKYVIKVCDGTACHVRKSLPILQIPASCNALMKNTQKLPPCRITKGVAPVVVHGQTVVGSFCGDGGVVDFWYSANRPANYIRVFT